jgi:hypothetical protein
MCDVFKVASNVDSEADWILHQPYSEKPHVPLNKNYNSAISESTTLTHKLSIIFFLVYVTHRFRGTGSQKQNNSSSSFTRTFNSWICFPTRSYERN